MEEEKVSVIIPVYNVEEFLARCLDSIIAQTYKNLEIICVNDGSTDSSPDILEHYAQFDSRIKIINKENGGLSSARNTGLSAAVGEYIFFLDSDDRVASYCIKHLVNNAKKNNADLVVFDFLWRDPSSGKYTITTIPEFKNFSQDKVFNIDNMGSLTYKIIPVMVWTKLYKASLIKDNGMKFSEEIIFEDVPFWAEIYTKSKRITYLQEPLYFYNMRMNSLMAQNNEKVFDVIKVYDKVEKVFTDAGYWTKYKPTIQAMMMSDFFHKFNVLKPELREKFFYKLKSLDKDIDYKIYEDSSYSPVDRACAKRFELLKKSDYVTFCNTPFEVQYNERL